MRSILLVAVVVALLPMPAGAEDDLVQRLEIFKEKFGKALSQATEIDRTLFLEDAPQLHVNAMLTVCGELSWENEPVLDIAKVAKSHEDLFGPDDDELLRVLIASLAKRAGYAAGYENALRLGFRLGLDRNMLCSYALERARQLQEAGSQ